MVSVFNMNHHIHLFMRYLSFIVKDFHGLLSLFYLHQKHIAHICVVSDLDDVPPIRIRCMYLLLS